MKTVSVTGGEVVLRERGDIRIIDRQRLQAAMTDAAPRFAKFPTDEAGNVDVAAAAASGVLTGADLTQMFELTKAAVLARLVSWTLPEPLPTNAEMLDNLTATVWDELAEAVSDGLIELLGDVNFDPSNPRAEGFSATPTQP